MKYWEIIADKLQQQGWSYGIAGHFTSSELIYCVDAQRDGKRFILKAPDLLTAFLALEAISRIGAGVAFGLITVAQRHPSTAPIRPGFRENQARTPY